MVMHLDEDKIMNQFISIVVPVFNVEKYLPRCMETILNQSYDNYEVILVDDGSTDGSSRLCDEYAQKNNNVRVLHKNNGGLSSARNVGIQMAKAELITLVDSDDFISEDYLEYLYGLMVRYDADMACASHLFVYGFDRPHYKETVPKEEVLDTEKALERICYTSVGANKILYKKEVLLKHPYPEGRLYEDLATTYKLIAECHKIAFSNKILYFVIKRMGSITNSNFNEHQYDAFWAADNQLQYITENYPSAVVAAKVRCIMAGLTLLNMLISQECDDAKIQFKRIHTYMKPYIWTVIMRSKASLNIKLSSLAVWLGYTPCKAFWWIKGKIKNMIGRKLV